jgi:FkbM family methyltransferase
MSLRGLPVLKRLIPSMRKWIAALTWPGGFKVVRRHDVLLRLNYRNYVDRELLFYGKYEREQIAALTSAMARHGCDLFLDVGANVGLYSLVVATRGLARGVIAFEPDARSLGPLQTNLSINGVASAVDIRAVALSDHDGSVWFKPDPGTSTCRSSVSADGELSVPCTRLDTVLPATGKRLFLKIDIEGHELAALNGMRDVLGRNQCFLQVESFTPNTAALDAFMHGLGYSHTGQIGDDHYYNNFVRGAGGGIAGIACGANIGDAQGAPSWSRWLGALRAPC